MLEIEDKIVSLDLIEEYFVCDLNACSGVCCVDGDAGAPLTEDELLLIEDNYEKIKKYLPHKQIEHIEKNGLYELDPDGDFVTTCLDSGECVFVTQDDDGIYKCAFEIAYRKGEIDFIKPISCHLYPVRLTKYGNFTAVNYEKRNICQAGRLLGKKNNVKVYEFLKEPLERAFGKEWFEMLDYAAKNLNLDD